MTDAVVGFERAPAQAVRTPGIAGQKHAAAMLAFVLFPDRIDDAPDREVGDGRTAGDPVTIPERLGKFQNDLARIIVMQLPDRASLRKIRKTIGLDVPQSR